MQDVIVSSAVPQMTQESIDKVQALETEMRKYLPLDFATDHVLHAGIYCRTIKVQAGVLMTGVLIQVPTVLVVSGDVIIYTGAEPLELHGYHVLPASAHRRQALLTLNDTWFTMIYATQAKSVPEVEEQFTPDYCNLGSRIPGAINTIRITGE